MPEDNPEVPLLGYAEIAAATGQNIGLIRVWMNRGKLPSPDFRLGQSPGWLEETINPWIRANQK